MVLVACCLVAYALGIVTNFFGQPMFRVFFVVSYSTAHEIVAYAAIAGGVGVGVAALIMGLLRNRKTVPHAEADKNLYVPIITSSAFKLETFCKTEKVVEQKSAPRPITQTVAEPRIGNGTARLHMSDMANKSAQTVKQPKIEDETVTRMANPVNKDKIICSDCKKEFSTPLIMLDYSQATPKLVSYCPYCNQPVNAQQKSRADEEIWKKYVKNDA